MPSKKPKAWKKHRPSPGTDTRRRPSCSASAWQRGALGHTSGQLVNHCVSWVVLANGTGGLQQFWPQEAPPVISRQSPEANRGRTHTAAKQPVSQELVTRRSLGSLIPRAAVHAVNDGWPLLLERRISVASKVAATAGCVGEFGISTGREPQDGSPVPLPPRLHTGTCGSKRESTVEGWPAWINSATKSNQERCASVNANAEGSHNPKERGIETETSESHVRGGPGGDRGLCRCEGSDRLSTKVQMAELRELRFFAEAPPSAQRNKPQH